MSGETVTMTDQYLVWMWQHYSLSLFRCDTLEEAVGTSEAIQDNGDGSLECIEGLDGIVAAEDIEPILERRRAAERARWDEVPKSTHWITIASPDGRNSSHWESYTSGEEAEAELASLRERFGDRAKLHRAKA